MTKMVKQKAEYVYDTYTEVRPLTGWLSIFNFLVEIYKWILVKRWSKKIAKMSDGEIQRRYYELTQRGEDDDYVISKAVIRSTDE